MFAPLISGLLALSLFAGGIPATPVPAVEKPQVIKLERFRKALWKIHLTVNGVPGDFLFDTGGGVTLLSKDFAPKIECNYWGRSTGYNMFGKRGDDAHCDGVQLMAFDGKAIVSLIARDYADAFGLDPAAREQRLRVDIAPGVSVDSPVMIADMIMDGNLGQPFMSQYVLTLDMDRGRLWAAKAGPR